jgi:hypothetical protein
MSYKNLKLNVWVNPTTKETRIYINTQWVDGRHGMGLANGCWITADANGAPQWGFKRSYDGEGRGFALCEVARYIADLPGVNENDLGTCKIGLTFAELKARVEASVTAKGHFSFSRYEKAYHRKAA